MILRDEKNASQGDKTERNKERNKEREGEKESKRERSRHPKQNHFFGSDLFERLFPFFLTPFECVRE